MKRTGWERLTGRLLLALAVMIAAVFALHVVGQLVSCAVGPENRVVTDIAARLSVDSELSVPTWLAAFIALIGAGLAYTIGKASPGGSRAAWYVLALLLAAISLDEIAALHELLLQGLHILAQFGEAQTLWANAWLLVLPFVVLAAVAVGLFARRHVPGPTLRRIGVAAAVYAAGAVFVEYLSIPVDKSSLMYLLGLAAIEEGLEFIGLWLFVRACLLHITRYQPPLKKKMEAIWGP